MASYLQTELSNQPRHPEQQQQYLSDHLSYYLSVHLILKVHVKPWLVLLPGQQRLMVEGLINELINNNRVSGQLTALSFN